MAGVKSSASWSPQWVDWSSNVQMKAESVGGGDLIIASSYDVVKKRAITSFHWLRLNSSIEQQNK